VTDPAPLPAAPLIAAQQCLADALADIPSRTETVPLEAAPGRILGADLSAPEDLPPYPRVIAEGYVIHSAESAGASKDNPAVFRVVGIVRPGDSAFPDLAPGTCVEVATGSIVADGPLAVARMWEARRDGDTIQISRPFPPRFFMEECGAEVARGTVVIPSGTRLTPAHMGTIAALGIDQVPVTARPRVTLFSSGDEVIPHTQAMRPGAIRDSNRPMLTAALREAGGDPVFGGIMGDDFNAFKAALTDALANSHMILISGGTAVGGRDFIADLVRAVGELVVDGVPMRSGRPLIMGVARDGNGTTKPIVCVAGHPPEALRGMALFGQLAIDRLTGARAPLPADPDPGPPGGGPGGPGGGPGGKPGS